MATRLHAGAAVLLLLLATLAHHVPAARTYPRHLQDVTTSSSSLPPPPPQTPSPPAPPPYVSPQLSCTFVPDQEGFATFVPDRAQNYGTDKKPKSPDALFDLMTDVCNFIANATGRCCYKVDPYADTVLADTFATKQKAYSPVAYGQVTGVTYVQTQDTPWTTLQEDYVLCSNVENNMTTMPCSITRSYTKGTATTLSHSWTAGGKITTEVGGKTDVIVAEGTFKVAVEVNFAWNQAESQQISSSTTDTFASTIPTPPGDCYRLWLNNQVATGEVLVQSTAPITPNAGVAMLFDQTVVTPQGQNLQMPFPGRGGNLALCTGATPDNNKCIGNANLLSIGGYKGIFAYDMGLYFATISDWLDYAASLGYHMSPFYQSIYDAGKGTFTKTDYLSVSAYTSKAFVEVLDPHSDKCMTPQQ